MVARTPRKAPAIAEAATEALVTIAPAEAVAMTPREAVAITPREAVVINHLARCSAPSFVAHTRPVDTRAPTVIPARRAQAANEAAIHTMPVWRANLALSSLVSRFANADRINTRPALRPPTVGRVDTELCLCKVSAIAAEAVVIARISRKAPAITEATVIARTLRKAHATAEAIVITRTPGKTPAIAGAEAIVITRTVRKAPDIAEAIVITRTP